MVTDRSLTPICFAQVEFSFSRGEMQDLAMKHIVLDNAIRSGHSNEQYQFTIGLIIRDGNLNLVRVLLLYE